MDALIAFLDDLGGDPDLEDGGDDEPDDIAEEDDPSGQCDEDEVNTSLDRVRYTVGASGAGCPISDEGGGNVEDGPQHGAGQDYYPEKPRYAVDQSKGAINGHLIGQRFQLKEQLAGLVSSGSREYARQIRRQIERVDKQEADLIALANDN